MDALTLKLIADAKQFSGGLVDAGRAVDDFQSGVSSQIAMVRNALGALAMVGGAAMFAGLIKESIDAKAKLNDLSIASGLSVEALSGMQEVGVTTETSAEMIAGAVNKMSKSLAGQTEESKGAAQALRTLGLDFNEFQQLSADDQMLAVAQAMGGVDSSTTKSAVAMQLFGKTGADLLPFMADLAAAGEIHATVTTAQAAAADTFADNLALLQHTGEAWMTQLTNGMAPALADTSTAFLNVINGSGGLREQLQALVADGTIERWTRNAVTGLTYVMDVGSGVIRIVETIGTVWGGLSAVVITAMEDVIAVAIKLMSGDFIGAQAATEAFANHQRAIQTQLVNDLDAIWSRDSMGQQIRKQIEAVQATGAAHAAVRGPLKSTAAAQDEVSKAAEQEAKKLAELAEQVKATSAGVSKDYVPTLLRLLQLKASGRITTDEYAAAVADLTSKQQAAKDAVRELIEADKEALENLKALADLQRLQLDNADKRIESIEQETAALNESAQRMLLTAEQLRALERRRLDDAIATAQQVLQQRLANNASTEMISLASLEVESLIALRSAREATYSAEAVVAYRGAQLEMWQSVDQAAHDTFVNVFDQGDDVFKRLGQTIKASILDLLYQMTIRPLVFQVVGSLMGGLPNSLLGNAQGLGGLGGNGLLGQAGNWLGSTIFGSAGAYATAVPGLALGGQQAAMLAAQTGEFGLAGLSATAEAGGASFLGTLGTAMPYIAGVLAVYSLLSGSFGGETRGGGQYGYNFGEGVYNNRRGTWLSNPTEGVNLMEGPSGGEIAGTQVRTAIDTTVNGINGLLQSMGSQAALTGFWAGIENSENNRGGWFSGGRMRRADGSTVNFGESGQGDNYQGTLYENGGGSYTAEEAFQGFGQDLQQVTIQALQAAGDLPATIAAQIEDIDAESLTAEAAQAIILSITQQVAGANVAQQAMAPLGGVFSQLATMSLDARIQLVNLSGGIQAMAAQAQSFVSNYYSADEQAGINARSVIDTLVNAGIDVTGLDTREEFRALVEGLDLSTETGREQYAALMAAQEQFAQLANYMAEHGGDLASLAGLTPEQLAQMLQDAAEAGTGGTDTSTDGETGTDTAPTAVETASIETATASKTTAQKMGELVDAQAAAQAQTAALLERLITAINQVADRPVEITLTGSEVTGFGGA